MTDCYDLGLGYGAVIGLRQPKICAQILNKSRDVLKQEKDLRDMHLLSHVHYHVTLLRGSILRKIFAIEAGVPPHVQKVIHEKFDVSGLPNIEINFGRFGQVRKLDDENALAKHSAFWGLQNQDQWRKSARALWDVTDKAFEAAGYTANNPEMMDQLLDDDDQAHYFHISFANIGGGQSLASVGDVRRIHAKRYHLI